MAPQTLGIAQNRRQISAAAEAGEGAGFPQSQGPALSQIWAGETVQPCLGPVEIHRELVIAAARWIIAEKL
jgi:hypothetical protein